MNTTTRNLLAVPVISRSHGKDEGKVIAVRRHSCNPHAVPAQISKLSKLSLLERCDCDVGDCVNMPERKEPSDGTPFRTICTRARVALMYHAWAIFSKKA